MLNSAAVHGGSADSPTSQKWDKGTISTPLRISSLGKKKKKTEACKG